MFIRDEYAGHWNEKRPDGMMPTDMLSEMERWAIERTFEYVLCNAKWIEDEKKFKVRIGQRWFKFSWPEAMAMQNLIDEIDEHVKRKRDNYDNRNFGNTDKRSKAIHC